MDFNNSKWVKRLRLGFLTLGLCWLLAVTLLIFVDLFTPAVILAGLFFVAMAIIAMMNFQYVRVTVQKEKLTIRYYSIFAVDRLFRLIEIPVEQLRKVETRNHLLGLKWEIRFTVRVSKGLADYPWISLSAIPARLRTRLILALRDLAPQKPS